MVVIAEYDFYSHRCSRDRQSDCDVYNKSDISFLFFRVVTQQLPSNLPVRVGEPVERDMISTFALDLKESATFSNVLEEFALPRAAAEELARGVVVGGEGASKGGRGLGWQFPCLNIHEFYPVDTLTLLHQVR